MVSQSRSAQVMLEYLVMAMIVLAAILFGGPVLVNSIGAHFKIAENNAGDAFSEKIKQASPEVCACDPMSTNAATWPAVGACGAGCGPLETNRRRECLPAGCAVQEKCGASRDCCFPAVKGACGSLPMASVALCVSRENLDAVSQNLVSGAQGRCLDTNGAMRGCLATEAVYTAECGEGARRYVCVPDAVCEDEACESTMWTPATDTVCAGTDMTQTGDCGDTRTVQGTLGAQCPAASAVPCGDNITSTNGCGTCTGTGTADSNCNVGYRCVNGGCVLICHYRPSDIYMASHYYSASNCGHTPSCNTMNVPSGTVWISQSQEGGRCGGSRWRHRQCGTLYRAAGNTCHGDVCVRGLVPQGAQVTFHMGRYNGVTRTCDWSSNVQRDRNSSGFAFAGNNNGYGNNGSVASWGAVSP